MAKWIIEIDGTIKDLVEILGAFFSWDLQYCISDIRKIEEPSS